MAKEVWPSWRYGPNRAKGIFERPEDVPEGWVASRSHVFEAARPTAPIQPIESGDRAGESGEPAEAPSVPAKRGPGRPKKG